MALLRLEDINVVFEKKSGLFSDDKKIHVLKNLCLEINRGEIIALVGESGCGKTTTGKVITGLQMPNSGKIWFEDKLVFCDGKKVGNSKSMEKEIQFIQQDSYAALNPVKTIEQNLTNAIRCANSKLSRQEIKQEIERLMQLIGLTPTEQYLSKYPHNLSGGQRQRVLMARAIAFRPKIIVADEPVSMIDVSLRITILNLMAELNQKYNISFVYITHDLATARYVANNGKLCVMYLGEIVESGDVNSVLNKPRHPYTKALIKAVPDIHNNYYGDLPLKSMNLASLEDRGEGCAFCSRCLYATQECSISVKTVNCNGVKVRCNNCEE